eukprot:gene11649-20049_t
MQELKQSIFDSKLNQTSSGIDRETMERALKRFADTTYVDGVANDVLSQVNELKRQQALNTQSMQAMQDRD